MENYLATEKIDRCKCNTFFLTIFDERCTSGFFEIYLLLCLDQYLITVNQS